MKVEKEHLLIRMIEDIRIMTLGRIWRATDFVSAQQDLSVAQLAPQAGLDRKMFAKSKLRRDDLTLYGRPFARSAGDQSRYVGLQILAAQRQ